ncbi:Acyl-CoA N-acyltransferase [Akanthomyces lecanii RCEF 1005]|uniref:Acyl-CoA N-acyltransferase n=1 Tax=Akanthomyces lecanii RCEF 1005 TaxID=1081108 RepID=A0A162KL54_CORDF|nr:Acyl-CoA N-acyltransferase [Akanthomyces lecanii RCEF 1005]
MPLQMRVATEADTDAIARLATAAFDPATDAIARNLFPARLQPAVPKPEDPAMAWRRTRKGIKMQTERIILMVVTDDQLGDKIVGFSMWEEPLPEGQAGESMTKGVVPCETLDEEAYNELRRASHEATVDFLGKDGSKHMWYLDYLGVDPGQQRRGIGKMLLNWGLEKAQEQGKDAYLIATPAGRPLYQAAGFEDLGAFMLFDTPHYGMIKRRLAS